MCRRTVCGTLTNFLPGKRLFRNARDSDWLAPGKANRNAGEFRVFAAPKLCCIPDRSGRDGVAQAIPLAMRSPIRQVARDKRAAVMPPGRLARSTTMRGAVPVATRGAEAGRDGPLRGGLTPVKVTRPTLA